MRSLHRCMFLFARPLLVTASLCTPADGDHPGECSGDMYDSFDRNACKEAYERGSERARASVAHLDPFVGKRLFDPKASEGGVKQRFKLYPNWHALLPCYDYHGRLIPEWTTEPRTLTLADFPEEVNLRQVCIPYVPNPGFIMEWVPWRWVLDLANTPASSSAILTRNARHRLTLICNAYGVIIDASCG